MRRTTLRVLVELWSSDLRTGAANDALDLARLTSPGDVQFIFCGAIEPPIARAAARYRVRTVCVRSRMISKRGAVLYAASVLAWIARLLWLRPHVVHLNYAGYAPSLACAAWILRIPVVARPGREYVEGNYANRWVAAYVANCVQQAEGLLRSPLASRLVVVGDLFSPERLKATAPSTRHLPITCRPGAVAVLFLGQLVERKGLMTLVEAFSRVRANADLQLIGGDWDAPGYPQQVRTRLAELGLSNRVQLHNHRKDVGPLLRQASVFVLPSFDEARPRSIIEAMLLGVPVIASNVGGIPTMIEDEVSGLLVPPGDPGALGAAIERLCASPEERRRLGEAGRRRAEQECRPHETAARYLATYRAVSQQDAHARLTRRSVDTRVI